MESGLWEDVEPTPGFEPGTFSLPTMRSVARDRIGGSWSRQHRFLTGTGCRPSFPCDARISPQNAAKMPRKCRDAQG